MQTGAIILCGGQSSRMGRDKATLPFGPEMMLQRVVRLLSEVVDPRGMVVVAASDQNLPSLPSDVSIARDHQRERGPLEGLLAGMESVAETIDAAYVTSCDVPLLVPAFVTRMFELATGFEIAVPREGENFHPLAAVYRPSVLSHIRRLLDADQLRMRLLFDAAKTRIVNVDELTSVDPQLRTLTNLNFPEDYQKALQAAGLDLGQPMA